MALLTGLTLVVSSCGFGPGTSDDPDTLSLLVASYSDATEAGWNRIIDDFRRDNPDITVNLQVESWDSINDVVRTRLQSPSTTPDILNIDAYSSFATDGQLYRASDVVSPAVLDDIDPGFARNASIDGTQWALPLFASTRTLFYNTDLFARAGIAGPPKTWAELTDAAAKIRALGGDVAGYGLPLGSEEAQGETSVWTFGAGGSWSDGDEITADTPANERGVGAMKSLAESGATQTDPGSTDRADVINAFVQGKIGMIEGLPPVLGMIAEKNPGLHYATAPTPTASGDPVTLGVADHLMAFEKNGTKAAAIRKFLDHFYSADMYSRFVAAEHFIPVTASGTRAMADDPVVRTFSPTLPAARFYPSNNPQWGAVQGALRQQIGTVAQGADPASVLDKIQQAAK